jgi:hypothetical protein
LLRRANAFDRRVDTFVGRADVIGRFAGFFVCAVYEIPRCDHFLDRSLDPFGRRVIYFGRHGESFRPRDPDFRSRDYFVARRDHFFGTRDHSRGARDHSWGARDLFFLRRAASGATGEGLARGCFEFCVGDVPDEDDCRSDD